MCCLTTVQFQSGFNNISISINCEQTNIHWPKNAGRNEFQNFSSCWKFSKNNNFLKYFVIINLFKTERFLLIQFRNYFFQFRNSVKSRKSVSSIFVAPLASDFRLVNICSQHYDLWLSIALSRRRRNFFLRCRCRLHSNFSRTADRIKYVLIRINILCQDHHDFRCITIDSPKTKRRRTHHSQPIVNWL